MEMYWTERPLSVIPAVWSNLSCNTTFTAGVLNTQAFKGGHQRNPNDLFIYLFFLYPFANKQNLFWEQNEAK